MTAIHIKERIKTVSLKKLFLGWWPVLLAMVLCALVAAAQKSPEVTEQIYARGIYRAIAYTYGRLTSFLPFSLAECAILAMLLGALACFIGGIVRLVKSRRNPAEDKILWGRFLRRALCLLCAALDVFLLFGGYNYYRPTFTSFSGLTVRESSNQELAALCEELSQQASELRAQLSETADGVMVLQEGFYDLSKQAREAFGALSSQYPDILPDYKIRPKPVLNSWWMSKMQITGVFSPYTFEANINVAAPDYSVPATMCHELAHTRGFMREDEANFIGYLACRQSDSLELQYSGVMLALVHTQNRLYSADRDLFVKATAPISEAVWRDFSDNNDYWSRNEGTVAAVSTAVNNTYLKANKQSDGVQSYGRMVDLLLADYRQRHGGETKEIRQE